MHPRPSTSSPARDRRRDVDTHEYLKQQMLFQNGGGGNFIADGVQPYDQFQRYSSNPPLERFNGGGRANERPQADGATLSGFPVKNKDSLEVSRLQRVTTYTRDKYVRFDSVYKKSTLEEYERGIIRFSMQEVLGGERISDIIEMEISTFTIPKIDQELVTPNYPQSLHEGKVFLTIEPLTAQSVHGDPSARRYHFEFKVVDQTYRYQLIPIRPKFIFAKPLKDIEELTFSFVGTNDIPLAFKPDVINFEPIHGTSPAQIHGAYPHRLPQPVFITAIKAIKLYFPTPIVTPTPQEVVDGLLNDRGHNTQNIPNDTDLEFLPIGTVGFDFAGLPPAPEPAFTVDVVISDHRVAPTIRFRSITKERTNNITPI